MPARLLRVWRWWRRHPLFALLLLLAVMLGVRLAWGWMAERDLTEQMGQMRSRGEPATLGEIRYSDVAANENAWAIQMQAADALVPNRDSPRSSSLEYGEPPYGPAWFALAAGSEAAHGQAFALLRKARQYSKAQFRKQMVAPTYFGFFGYFNNAKHLANIVGDGAEYAHFTGNDDEALERLLDLMHLARSMRQDDFLVSQLVAMGVEALACNAIQRIAPDLGEGRGVLAKPQAADKVRQLMRELLDEQMVRDGMARSMHIEGLVRAENLRTRAAENWVIRPLAHREIIRALVEAKVLARVKEAKNFPETLDLLKSYPSLEQRQTQPVFLFGSPKANVPRYSRWFDDPDLMHEAIFERHFRIIAERRVTALALACQLYRSEHGRLPEKLEELVPKYIAAVPMDPFHADGRAIGFVVLKKWHADGSDRAVLYFDPGGPDQGVITTPMYGWHTPRGALAKPVRQYRDLSRFPAGSTKAINGQPNQPNAPGENPEENDPTEKP